MRGLHHTVTFDPRPHASLHSSRASTTTRPCLPTPPPPHPPHLCTTYLLILVCILQSIKELLFIHHTVRTLLQYRKGGVHVNLYILAGVKRHDGSFSADKSLGSGTRTGVPKIHHACGLTPILGATMAAQSRPVLHPPHSPDLHTRMPLPWVRSWQRGRLAQPFASSLAPDQEGERRSLTTQHKHMQTHRHTRTHARTHTHTQRLAQAFSNVN